MAHGEQITVLGLSILLPELRLAKMAKKIKKRVAAAVAVGRARKKKRVRRAVAVVAVAKRRRKKRVRRAIAAVAVARRAAEGEMEE